MSMSMGMSMNTSFSISIIVSISISMARPTWRDMAHVARHTDTKTLHVVTNEELL